MEITLNNAHEEATPAELEMVLRAEVTRLANELEQSREVAREEAERAENRRIELKDYFEERMNTQRERYAGELTAKQERIDAILATDQGTAYIDVEDMKRRVERMSSQLESALLRERESEASAERAWASVNGAEDIDPRDPRVAHIWRKASRIATHAGFCTEYDRIADSLGIPEVEFDYDGSVSVRVSAYVTVPVSGTATRREIADGDVDWSISNDDIVAELDGDMIEWEVDEVDISANDN